MMNHTGFLHATPQRQKICPGYWVMSVGVCTYIEINANEQDSDNDPTSNPTLTQQIGAAAVPLAQDVWASRTVNVHDVGSDQE
jgi:hypothetical protein